MSLRFAAGLVFSAFICLLSLRALGKIPMPAFVIVALAWFSLACDLMCYACYTVGITHYPIEHLYALFEFLAQLLFVYLISTSTRLKQSILLVIPIFFGAWVYSQMAPGIVDMKNEPAIFFATSIANAYILFVLRSQAKSVSQSSQISHSILAETLRQLFLSELGKIFIGLFLYNLFQLSLFFLILGIENFSEGASRYIASFSHFVKNTLIAMSFIQSLRKGTSNA